MNRILLSTCLATLSVIATVPCFAAGTPWDGTWKENLTKSKLTGDTIVFTEKPNGMLHYAAGGMMEYDFACDGKPYPTLPGRTLTCSGNPESGYDFSMTMNGVLRGKSHRTFSADGKTMTIKGADTLPDGSTPEYEEVYQRQSGTTGLVGKWLDVKVNADTPRVETWSVNNRALHVDAPALKLTLDAKLDGSDGTVSGPTVPPGATITLKPDGENKLTYTVTLNGKILVQGIYTVSADGKTLTDETWFPGRESEKATTVWDKQ
jgi:hypothetical protein